MGLRCPEIANKEFRAGGPQEIGCSATQFVILRVLGIQPPTAVQSTSGHQMTARVAWTVIFLAGSLMGAERRVVGLSASGKPIEALVVSAAPPTAPTVMLIGGLNGGTESGQMVSAAVEDLESDPPSRRRFHLLAIPLANPDKSPLVFPPTGVAYRENAESHVLWRWIALQAPDLVLIVGRRRRRLSPGAFDECRCRGRPHTGARDHHRSSHHAPVAAARYSAVGSACRDQPSPRTFAAGAGRGAGAVLRARFQSAHLYSRHGADRADAAGTRRGCGEARRAVSGSLQEHSQSGEFADAGRASGVRRIGGTRVRRSKPMPNWSARPPTWDSPNRAKCSSPCRSMTRCRIRCSWRRPSWSRRAS